jgi:DDE superfamily endonuclease
LIEAAYTTGPSLGLAVWCEDEAGPFQAVPHAGSSWQPEGHPARQPHEYVRGGTAKVLTLFRPADGRVRVEGATTCPNTVLHPWLERELSAILGELPALPPTADTSRAAWARWQAGLTVRITLPEQLPPLRVLLVLDNLAGHKTPALVLWLFAHGVMPLFTPLGGSWLNMAEKRPAGAQATGAGRGAPDEPGRDHRPVRVGRGALERGADAVRVGRQACRAEEAGTGAPPCGGWLGRLHSAAAPTPILWPRARQVTH